MSETWKKRKSIATGKIKKHLSLKQSSRPARARRPDLGISESFKKIFVESYLVGIGLGKSKIFGDKHGEIS